MSENAMVDFIGVLSTVTAEVQRVLGPESDVRAELAGLNADNGLSLQVRISAGTPPNVGRGIATFTALELGQARDPLALVQFRVRETAYQVRELIAVKSV